MPIEVTPAEVKSRQAAGERLHLIDVREPLEHQQAAIAGADLIPMRTVPSNLQTLEGQADEATLIVLCHHGMRSLQVVNWLREQGIANCQSLAGGIERWSTDVDPSVPRY